MGRARKKQKTGSRTSNKVDGYAKNLRVLKIYLRAWYQYYCPGNEVARTPVVTRGPHSRVEKVLRLSNMIKYWNRVASREETPVDTDRWVYELAWPQCWWITGARQMSGIRLGLNRLQSVYFNFCGAACISPELGNCCVIRKKLCLPAQIRSLALGLSVRVNDSAFQGFSALTSLVMEKQREITDAAFVHLRRLQVLDISYCRQSTITDSAFQY